MELKQTNESEEALSSCCLSDPLLCFAPAVRAPRSLHPLPGARRSAGLGPQRAVEGVCRGGGGRTLLTLLPTVSTWLLPAVPQQGLFTLTATVASSSRWFRFAGFPASRTSLSVPLPTAPPQKSRTPSLEVRISAQGSPSSMPLNANHPTLCPLFPQPALVGGGGAPLTRAFVLPPPGRLEALPQGVLSPEASPWLVFLESSPGHPHPLMSVP